MKETPDIIALAVIILGVWFFIMFTIYKITGNDDFVEAFTTITAFATVIIGIIAAMSVDNDKK